MANIVFHVLILKEIHVQTIADLLVNMNTRDLLAPNQIKRVLGQSKQVPDQSKPSQGQCNPIPDSPDQLLQILNLPFFPAFHILYFHEVPIIAWSIGIEPGTTVVRSDRSAHYPTATASLDKMV